MSSDELKGKRASITAWTITLTVMIVAFLGWGPRIDWDINKLTSYSLFPLFGLSAFSIMWSHYIVGSFRRLFGVDKKSLRSFFKITGWLVLILIVLHPSLLIFRLFKDGFGLPPSSYLENYVAPSLKWAALLGTASFFVFLSYEFKRWFEKKDWWRYVVYANIVAMIGILVHSLSLGSDLQAGWLRYLWFIYAVTFVISVIYNYWFDGQNDKLSKE